MKVVMGVIVIILVGVEDMITTIINQTPCVAFVAEVPMVGRK